MVFLYKRYTINILRAKTSKLLTFNGPGMEHDASKYSPFSIVSVEGHKNWGGVHVNLAIVQDNRLRLIKINLTFRQECGFQENSSFSNFLKIQAQS